MPFACLGQSVLHVTGRCRPDRSIDRDGQRKLAVGLLRRGGKGRHNQSYRCSGHNKSRPYGVHSKDSLIDITWRCPPRTSIYPELAGRSIPDLVGRHAWPKAVPILANIKLYALGERKVVAEIDGAGDPAHVRLPSVGAGLAPAAGFLLAAKCAPNLRARRSYIGVCDAAIRAGHGDEFLDLMHVGRKN